MISGSAGPATDEDGIAQKKLWVEPVVAKLELSEAEASDGSGPDGSGMVS